MEYCSAVSSQSQLLIPIPDDPYLTPRPLHVNKRKRQSSQHSYIAHGSLATGSLAPAAKVRRAATMSDPSTFLKSQSTQDRDKATNSTRSSRAVTLGTTQWVDANRQATSHNVSSSSHQLSKPLSKGAETPPLDWNCSLDSDSQHTVRRLPSIKHRVLSRVMNTLTGKSSSSQLNAEDREVRRPSLGESTSNDSAGQTTNARTSFSTTARTSISDTNLETALSEFPQPPGSPLTVPASISAFEQAKLEFQAYRRLHAPSDAVVISPEILITPEVASVDANKDRSLYLAVEISAVAGPGRKSQNHCFYGLDVAVIIDNSLFASPATLMASCETARFLSSLLDPTNDRMAIICTSSLSAEYPDLRTSMPLACVNPRKTKAFLDTVVGSTERPNTSALGEAVRSARALLEQLTPCDQTSGLGSSAFGHIFVLTPHSSGLPSQLLTHDKIQMHLVCPGSVPWKGESKVRCNGWKLQSMHSKELHSVRFIKDEDPSSLFNKLRTVIMDARSGSLHGGVHDLVLDIKPGGNCTVEGVIGHRNITSIQLGERVVALVKLTIGLSPAAGYTLRSRPQRDDSSAACNDPDKELDELLGTTPVTVLSAKLEYKHSLLPPGTQCTLTKHCQVKRPLPSAQWANLRPRRWASEQHDPQVEVQKQLAFHIATHHEPRQAMVVLIQELGDGGRRSTCPNYIKLLIAELKYQARTIERFDLADHRSAPVAATPRELRLDVWGHEHFGQGLFDASDYKPHEWITDAPDEVTIQFPELSPSKLKGRNYQRSDETTDEARKIRLDLERRSKKQHGRSKGRGNRSSDRVELDDATRRLRDLALRNKRSVGAETLKRLAYPQHRGRTMASYSPWL